MTEKSRFIPNTFQCFNDYVDLMQELLTPEEFACLIFATRHILGWQDRISVRRARISLTMFEHGFTTESGTRYGGTGLSRAAIIKATDELDRAKLLVKVGKPTADGQEYELGEDGDLRLLEDRRAAKLGKALERTAKARAKAAETRAAKQVVSPTNQSAVSGTDQQRSVGLTDSGQSDRLNQTQLQTQLQTHAAANGAAAENRPPLFQTYEQAFGPLSEFIAGRIKGWMEDWPTPWIEDAIKQAAENNARAPIPYIEACLKAWQQNGKPAAGTSSKTPAKPAAPARAAYPANLPDLQTQLLEDDDDDLQVRRPLGVQP